MPLRTLFDAPTPAGLLAALRPGTAGAGRHRRSAALTGPAGPRTRARPAPRTCRLANGWTSAGFTRPDRLELSHAQSRMWFLNQLDPGAADYNISLAVRLTGNLDEQALATAVAALFRRHEVLRTVYPETAGVPGQPILRHRRRRPRVRWTWPSAPPHPRPTSATAAGTGRSRGFDVRTELPLRAGLDPVRLRCAPGGSATADGGPQWVLHLVMHHIASDGASLAPLAQDLSAAYAAASRPQLSAGQQALAPAAPAVRRLQHLAAAATGRARAG